MRRYRQGKKRRYRLVLALALFVCIFFAQEKEPPKEAAAEVETEAANAVAARREISLVRAASGGAETMDLEAYILGVIAAEVPPKFESEAMKAQAIAARTYALATLEQGGVLCDDFGHCQAYYDASARRERWGASFDAYEKKYCRAVEETKGLVVTYKGALAKTFFHSTCGGQTSSAAEVWGSEIPYLQSVACTWDREAPRYEETRTFSKAEVAKLLSETAEAAAPVSAGVTESGRVATVSYQGKTIDATEFRRCLGLNSTRFSIDASGDTLTVTTKGYGHGVGLCQYGANGMARAGKTAAEILTYYYTDVEIRAYP